MLCRLQVWRTGRKEQEINVSGHTVELLSLLRGGRGESAIGGIPRAQLAVLPETTHPQIMDRVEWPFSMLIAFLGAPVPTARTARTVLERRSVTAPFQAESEFKLHMLTKGSRT